MIVYVQGAIQGPGEFAEGLFLGVRSLVGHTVGGAAGAVSRITGAMGHGLAALSLDKVCLSFFLPSRTGRWIFQI